MSLSLACSVTAMAPGLTTSFNANGGTAPYTYSVLTGTGTINSSTGVYTAPAVMNPSPALTTEIVKVTDSVSATATLSVLVTNQLGLFCNVIQSEMGLSDGRVYLWNQKIMQPTDSGLYIAIRVLNCRPFANTNEFIDGESVQSVNMLATLSVDIISRGPEARDRKEEVVMALNSDYAQSQQELNSFYISKLPPGGQMVDLSNMDGAAIPYRFNISVNIQYFVRKIKSVPYFDQFQTLVVDTQP